MAVDIEQIQVTLKAQMSDFVASMQKASEVMDRFTQAATQSMTQATQSAEKAETKIVTFSQAVRTSFSALGQFAQKAALGIVGLSVPVGLATKNMMDYERELRNVNSILHLSEADFQKLNKAVLQLAQRPDVYHRPVELARALYQAASAGYDAEAGLDLVAKASAGAMAGTSDLAKTLQVLIAVQRAGLPGAQDMNHALDALFKTVELGIVSFDELAGSLGYVIPIAASAGVSIDELGAYIALATLKGLSAETAVTALKNVIIGIMNPSKEAREIFRKLGIEFGTAAFKTHGLVGVLGQLSRIRDPDIIARLFGDIREFLGVTTALSGGGLKTFQDFLKSITASSGAAQRAANEMAKSLSVQLEKLRARTEAAATEILQGLVPAMQTLVGMLETTTGAVKGLFDYLGGFGTWMLKATAITGGLILAIHGLNKAWRLAKDAFNIAKTFMIQGLGQVIAKIFEAAAAAQGLWATIGGVAGIAGILVGLGYWFKYSSQKVREQLQKEFEQMTIPPAGGKWRKETVATLKIGAEYDPKSFADAERRLADAQARIKHVLALGKKEKLVPAELARLTEFQRTVSQVQRAIGLWQKRDIENAMKTITRGVAVETQKIARIQKQLEVERTEAGRRYLESELKGAQERLAMYQKTGELFTKVKAPDMTPITMSLSDLEKKAKKTKKAHEETVRDIAGAWIQQANAIYNLADRLAYLQAREREAAVYPRRNAKERAEMVAMIEKEIIATQLEIRWLQAEIQAERAYIDAQKSRLEIDKMLNEAHERGGMIELRALEAALAAYQQIARVLPDNLEAQQKIYEFERAIQEHRKAEADAFERMHKAEQEYQLRRLENAKQYSEALKILRQREEELANKVKSLKAAGAAASEIEEATRDWYSVREEIERMTEARTRELQEQYHNLGRAIKDAIQPLREMADIEEEIRRIGLPEHEAEFLRLRDEMARRVFNIRFRDLPEFRQAQIDALTRRMRDAQAQVAAREVWDKIIDVRTRLRLSVREREVREQQDRIAQQLFGKQYGRLAVEQRVIVNLIIKEEQIAKLKDKMAETWRAVADNAKQSLREAVESFFSAWLAGERNLRNAFKELLLDIKRLIMQAIAKIIVEELIRRLRDIFSGVFGRKDMIKSAVEGIAAAGITVRGAILGVASVFHAGKLTLASAIKAMAAAYLTSVGHKKGNVFMQIAGAVLGLFRQFGGPVHAGKPYIVGEAGPELFIPRQSGYIVPTPPPLKVVMPAVREQPQVHISVHIGQVNRQVDLSNAWRDLGWAVRAALARG